MPDRNERCKVKVYPSCKCKGTSGCMPQVEISMRCISEKCNTLLSMIKRCIEDQTMMKQRIDTGNEHEGSIDI